MPNRMKTFDALPVDLQDVVRDMANAARLAMRESGYRPMADDRAADFDEACAVFLNHTLIEFDHPHCVLS